MSTNVLPGSWWHRREHLEGSYETQLPALKGLLESLVSDVQVELKGRDISAIVRGRVKTFDAFYRKLLERSRTIEVSEPFVFVTDILGIRVVTPFVEDAQRTEAMLRDRYAVEEVDDKAEALSVGEFGYDSKHLLVSVPASLADRHDSTLVRVAEVQIRTTLQDAWAEVEHELVYKADLDVVNLQIRRKLMALNATLSLADTIFQEIRDFQKRRYAELRARHSDLMDKVSTIPEKFVPGRRVESRLEAGAPAEPGALSRSDETDEAMADVLVRALQAHLDADLAEAIALYSHVLAVTPTAAVLNHRGIAHFALSEYEKAIADFTQAIEIVPEHARGYTNRGLAYRMAGRLEEARADFDHSLELNPMWTDTLYGSALTHFDLGNIPEALRDCDRAIALNPGFKQVIRFKRFIQDSDL